MEILVIGDQYRFDECQKKFGHDHQYALAGAHAEAITLLAGKDVVFDFIIDETPQSISIFQDQPSKVFFNTAKTSLHQLAHALMGKITFTLFAFNGLPTLLHRDVLEVAIRRREDADLLSAVCQQLKTAYHVVDDRVGLVTPRVIAMIINEAYYTVQEGTAIRDAIDTAMKLGTNYPYGPFEWSQRIGLRHVYEVLEALYEDTRDERYKICPLLKKEYLQSIQSLNT